MSYHNLVFVSENIEITKACFNWCREQTAIHQSNIDISNLGAVAIAMAALMLYNISIEFPDEISKKLNIKKEQLRFIGHSVVFFAFTLLAGFLLYYLFSN